MSIYQEAADRAAIVSGTRECAELFLTSSSSGVTRFVKLSDGRVLQIRLAIVESAAEEQKGNDAEVSH